MESLVNFLGGGIKCNHNINKHITQALAVLPYITSKANLKVATISLITKYNDDMSAKKSGKKASGWLNRKYRILEKLFLC
jgi:hypothetical protein